MRWVFFVASTVSKHKPHFQVFLSDLSYGNWDNVPAQDGALCNITLNWFFWGYINTTVFWFKVITTNIAIVMKIILRVCKYLILRYKPGTREKHCSCWTAGFSKVCHVTQPKTPPCFIPSIQLSSTSLSLHHVFFLHPLSSFVSFSDLCFLFLLHFLFSLVSFPPPFFLHLPRRNITVMCVSVWHLVLISSSLQHRDETLIDRQLVMTHFLFVNN